MIWGGTVYAERKRHARHKQIGVNILEGLHNLKDRICDFENLMGAYRDAAKGKRYRNEVLDFTFHLGANLLKIQKELLEMTYKVGPYREFYVRYPKPRLVMALQFRDRIVQWAIYRQINPYLDKRYIEHSYGCRKNKGTLAAAQRLHEWQKLISRKPDADDYYLIKADIAKYFYRVDHGEALRTYENVSSEFWFMWLIGTIINNPDVPFGLPVGMKPDDCPRSKRLYEVGMPIGNLTSQETANMLLNRLDEFVKHVLLLHFYVRYMDDFCIIVKGKENAWTIYAAIERYLNEQLKLDVSPKSRIQKATDPVEFVGYLITPVGIRMRKKTTAHIKRSLNHICEGYADGEICFDAAKESLICYIGMCKNCNDYHMIRWIEEHFVLQRRESMIDEREKPPTNGRHFYTIQQQEDGTVDVYLLPDAPQAAQDGADGRGCRILAVRGVEPFDGLEDDLRARFYTWCACAEEVFI